jgi:hypothetical protein
MSYTYNTYPSQNHQFRFNDTSQHLILYKQEVNNDAYGDGYLAEYNFIDGQQLTPSDFGESGDYGEWKPIEYAGTYGNNGFYLDFKSSSSLGNDASSNSNNWTVNNLASTDQMVDTPTNNFATNFWWLSKFHSSYPSITNSEGNLKAEFASAGGGMNGAISSFAIPPTGKWYVERCVVSTGNGYGYPYSGVGILKGHPTDPISTAQSYYGAQSSAGDVYGLAYDADGETITWYKNNTQVSTASLQSSLVGKELHFILREDQNSGNKTMPFVSNFGQDSSFAGNKTAQGNQDGNEIGDFYYAPPTGFLALCTANLPDPTVIPSEHFNTVTYSGNGSASGQAITVGFQPDLTWLKIRNGANNHALQDSVRGTSKTLFSDVTNGESEYGTDLFSSFDTNGFTLGTGSYGLSNDSGSTYVGWNWKAGNATLGTGDFTQGTIASTCSRNVDAGFSIVSYTGTGSAGTVGHGLSQKPDLTITKDRDLSSGWIVEAEVIGSPTYALRLQDSSARQNDVGNILAPTASVLDIPSNWGGNNTSGSKFIAYCFHSVDGYSKVGSYSGNSSSNGSFVYCGFRPAYVMVKDVTNIQSWWVFDSDRDVDNPINKRLRPDSNTAEATGDKLDFVSNGFKWRDGDNAWNYTGDTYIYIAFAEMPFKHSNAR